MKREFPKILNIVWFQGEENITKQIFKDNIKNWKLLNPEWQVRIIDDNQLRQACINYSENCVKLYDSFNLLHLKVDFGRYVLLYNTGTMYVDMDCYALKSLDKLTKLNIIINKYINNEVENIIGLSSIKLDLFESYLFINNRFTINNAVMISSPKNPVIKLLIDLIIKQNLNNNNNYDDDDYFKIQNITGPVIINKFFTEFIKNPIYECHIEIFPYYIFEPNGPFGKYDIRETTIAIHKFEMTWIPDNLKDMIKFYFKFKIYIIILILLIFIYALICIINGHKSRIICRII